MPDASKLALIYIYSDIIGHSSRTCNLIVLLVL